MTRNNRNLRSSDSGQLLIVAALVIAVLISSTTVYIYDMRKERDDDTQPTNEFILGLKQATRNTMIGSLASISKGGENAVLATNLDDLAQGFRTLRRFGSCLLSFDVLNASDYSEGVWLSWNMSDRGVSSAYASFTLNVDGAMGNVTLNYGVNITTAIAVNGSFTILGGGEKNVTLTLRVANEGRPAPANNITILYQASGSWITVNETKSLSVVDLGDGSYNISFTVGATLDEVEVSIRILDTRNIFVQADTVCNET
jgi:hypothetical protein